MGIRQLKNQLSRYLRQLKPGQSIAITDRGRVVAELRVPLPEASFGDRSADLIAAGVMRAAQEEGDPLADWPTRQQVNLPPGTVRELIDEDRGD